MQIAPQVLVQPAPQVSVLVQLAPQVPHSPVEVSGGNCALVTHQSLPFACHLLTFAALLLTQKQARGNHLDRIVCSGDCQVSPGGREGKLGPCRVFPKSEPSRWPYRRVWYDGVGRRSLPQNRAS